jgi:hypothetical protein
MDLGLILVLILAGFFFGGVGILAWVTRRQQASEPDSPRSRATRNLPGN